VTPARRDPSTSGHPHRPVHPWFLGGPRAPERQRRAAVRHLPWPRDSHRRPRRDPLAAGRRV